MYDKRQFRAVHALLYSAVLRIWTHRESGASKKMTNVVILGKCLRYTRSRCPSDIVQLCFLFRAHGCPKANCQNPETNHDLENHEKSPSHQ